MEYQFLQWSEDGRALLLHFAAAGGRAGYFWYDIGSGEAGEVWETGVKIENGEWKIENKELGSVDYFWRSW